MNFQNHIASNLELAWMIVTNRRQYSTSQVQLAISIIRQHAVVRS